MFSFLFSARSYYSACASYSSYSYFYVGMCLYARLILVYLYIKYFSTWIYWLNSELETICLKFILFIIQLFY